MIHVQVESRSGRVWKQQHREGPRATVKDPVPEGLLTTHIASSLTYMTGVQGT